MDLDTFVTCPFHQQQDSKLFSCEPLFTYFTVLLNLTIVFLITVDYAMDSTGFTVFMQLHCSIPIKRKEEQPKYQQLETKTSLAAAAAAATSKPASKSIWL